MTDITKIVPWVFDGDIPEHMIKDAFTEIRMAGIESLAIAVNLITSKEKTTKSILRALHKMVYHASRLHLGLFFCFRHEKYSGSFTPKYIIPKNTSALCEYIRMNFALNASDNNVYLGMDNFLQANRNNYLVGISFREYDYIINLLPTIASTTQPNNIVFGGSPEDKIVAKEQILNEYDFIISDGADHLFTFEFRKELKDLYNTCIEAKMPVINTIHSCRYGLFAGTDHLICHSYVSGAQEYIYNDSWDMLMKKISYQNLASTIKNIQI